jgi:DNA (cytosine-5)-methyltransferase 1
MVEKLKDGILDLFCGPGGLSLGFLLEGFDIVYSNDIDENSIETVSKNHRKISEATGKKHVHSAEAIDIKKLSISKVQKEFQDKGYRVHGIIGGPPCKGFSMANMQTRFVDNPHNTLFKEYIRFVRGLEPDFFVFENVVGLLSMGDGRIKEEILRVFKDELGYNVRYKVLDSSDYGVPQVRKRVIILGTKNGQEFRFPDEVHKTKKKTNVRDAIGDLPTIRTGNKKGNKEYPQRKKISEYAKTMKTTPELNMASSEVTNHIITKSSPLVIERYKNIPQGGNWQNIPDELFENYANKKRCHSSIYRRLQDKSPSITISNFRKSMFVHPTQNRGLSVREAARIQSFPDWYEFSGTINSQQQQLADAVPPLMARAIAKQIKEAFK